MANQQERQPQGAGSAVSPAWMIAGIVAIVLIAGALWYYGTTTGDNATAVTTPAADSEQMSDEQMPADEGAPAEGAAAAGE